MPDTKKTRMVIISDTHCGHAVGLTPPAYQWQVGKRGVLNRQKAAVVQKESWKFYAKTIDALKPIDIGVLNGDLLEGKGQASGGVELLAPDMNEQVAIAVMAASYMEAKHYVIVHGTPYHTGMNEDFEDHVADKLRVLPGVKSVEADDHTWLDVNGCVFDFKHEVKASSSPTGRWHGLAEDALWNLLWHAQGEQPKADVLIRSHVHYHVFSGGADNPLALTMPALQAQGTRYGSRRLSGRVHLGLVYFDINENGSYEWQAVIAKLKSQRAQTTKLLI